MRAKRFLTGALLAATAATVIGATGPTVSAAPMPSPGSGTETLVNTANGVTTLIDWIEKKVNDASSADQRGRGDYNMAVATMFQDQLEAHGLKYNVAVLNVGNTFDHTLNDNYLGKAEGFPTADSRYRLFAFKTGTILNRGDGGYVNWYVTGSCDQKTKMYIVCSTPSW